MVSLFQTRRALPASAPCLSTSLHDCSPLFCLSDLIRFSKSILGLLHFLTHSKLSLTFSFSFESVSAFCLLALPSFIPHGCLQVPTALRYVPSLSTSSWSFKVPSCSPQLLNTCCSLYTKHSLSQFANQNSHPSHLSSVVPPLKGLGVTAMRPCSALHPEFCLKHLELL